MTQRDDEGPAAEKQSAAELLPVLYDELRRVAASLTADLPPGQILQPTALVHEAYLRLVKGKDPGWESRRHFFGAAAQAMREILIEQARQKASLKHGGQAQRIELAEGLAWIEPPSRDLLSLDEAIQQLRAADAQLAEIVLLRYYAGLSFEETAGVLGVPVRSLKRDWRVCAGLAGAAAERSTALMTEGIGMPQAMVDPTDERYRHGVRTLFAQAAELPQDERAAFLDAACRGEPDLRAEVEGLLAYDAGSGGEEDEDGFLKSPLVRAPVPSPPEPSCPPQGGEPGLPVHIGRYRILRRHGEGGMGTVYEAEQHNPRRTVALKVIRPGLVSPEIVKRFGQEAQILARLQHPGIAQVHESGMDDDGRPFFAMEFIRGMPLDEYARSRAATRRRDSNCSPRSATR